MNCRKLINYYLFWVLFIIAVITEISSNDGSSRLSECPSTPSLTSKPCSLKTDNDRFNTSKSQLTVHPGHWPPSYCQVTNTYLETAQNRFFVGIKELHLLDKCYGLQDIWTLTLKNERSERDSEFGCDQVFEKGHVFTVYYYHGSNYFHLHYDMAIPLFAAVHGSKPTDATMNTIVLMPSVEKQRGKGTDWTTDAFLDDRTYWMEILKVLSEPYRLLPLDQRLAAMRKTMCFKEISFGVPKVNLTSDFIRSFVSFVMNRLNVTRSVSTGNEKPIIGMIHRAGRRKILNEAELVQSVQEMTQVEVIDFSGMSFRDQVAAIQRFDVLVGANGAGLTNALYLPPESVAVQLVPYDAQLNVDEFAHLLKKRGPYVEWRSRNKNVSTDLKPTDSVVSVREFREVIAKALRLCCNGRAN